MNEFLEEKEPVVQKPEVAIVIDPIEEQRRAVEYFELMQKSRKKILFFVIFTLINICLIIVFQNQPLFIFNFQVEANEVPLISQFFSFLSYLFILVAFIYMISFSVNTLKNDKRGIVKQLRFLNNFKKQYNTFDLLSVVPYFLVFLMLVNGLFFGFASVVGPSMQPTFCDGDYVVINHADHDYQTEDIVIFLHSDAKLIKRLIGVPGDYLVVELGAVYLNGDLVESNVNNRYISYHGVIPEGFYFVMGDNRGNSNDSRYIGLIPEIDMLGTVVFSASGSSCPI